MTNATATKPARHNQPSDPEMENAFRAAADLIRAARRDGFNEAAKLCRRYCPPHVQDRLDARGDELHNLQGQAVSGYWDDEPRKGR